MKMERCKTCKWWKQLDWKGKEPTHSYCECPKIFMGNGKYMNAPDEAEVHGGLDLGEFITGPEFGCIHHEPARVLEAIDNPGTGMLILHTGPAPATPEGHSGELLHMEFIAGNLFKQA
jgi:hypothetical protein